MKTFLISILVVCICGCASGGCDEGTSIQEIIESEKDSLSGPFTVSELENAHMITIRETGEEKPFGYINAQWEELKAQMQEGDEIYFTAHSDGHYSHSGHILVREGCVVYFLLGSIV